MATIISDFFTVGGVPYVFVSGQVISDGNGRSASVKITSIAKHGVEIAVSDSERESLAAELLFKSRRGEDSDEECEPEDFNDRYDARRARWGHD